MVVDVDPLPTAAQRRRMPMAVRHPSVVAQQSATTQDMLVCQLRKVRRLSITRRWDAKGREPCAAPINGKAKGFQVIMHKSRSDGAALLQRTRPPQEEVVVLQVIHVD